MTKILWFKVISVVILLFSVFTPINKIFLLSHIKQILLGCTNNDNCLVIFAVVTLKLENFGLTFSSFNTRPSLPYA